MRFRYQRRAGACRPPGQAQVSSTGAGQLGDHLGSAPGVKWYLAELMLFNTSLLSKPGCQQNGQQGENDRRTPCVLRPVFTAQRGKINDEYGTDVDTGQ